MSKLLNTTGYASFDGQGDIAVGHVFPTNAFPGSSVLFNSPYDIVTRSSVVGALLIVSNVFLLIAMIAICISKIRLIVVKARICEYWKWERSTAADNNNHMGTSQTMMSMRSVAPPGFPAAAAMSTRNMYMEPPVMPMMEEPPMPMPPPVSNIFYGNTSMYNEGWGEELNENNGSFYNNFSSVADSENDMYSKASDNDFYNSANNGRAMNDDEEPDQQSNLRHRSRQVSFILSKNETK